MTKQQFTKALLEININISEEQLNKFDIYYKTLVEWNEKMNLTAITKEDEVYEKHFYDCLLASTMIDFSDQSIVDIGAGAGFPSIPLKIIFPNLKITIVDSLNKRIIFLKELINRLQIENVTAISGRAEEFALNNREKYDIATGRAVARLNILDELCLPLVKKNGYFLALKGKQGLEEAEEAKKGIDILGGKELNIKKYELSSEHSTRYLLLYKKVNKTPIKYPRSFGQIKKKPLWGGKSSGERYQRDYSWFNNVESTSTKTKF
ncbi:16S rRNA (guanine(527)-N(7))-methyltransferase RsmG [Mycoplasma sp. P36-A1]|uniref:16S rRNA (guanine(527)-N(7))-methyltransferase RsmG n=1 Tax=Mycoplasma sp. P36-A1 TaxID=3252900 RepID=UPI003C2B5093